MVCLRKIDQPALIIELGLNVSGNKCYVLMFPQPMTLHHWREVQVTHPISKTIVQM